MKRPVVVRADAPSEVAPAPAAPASPAAPAAPPSPADVFMRRLLRLPAQGSAGSITGARSAFSASIAVSAVRCLLTYVLLPLLAPVLDLTGGVGPVLGLVVGAVSVVAIVVAMRRFWAVGHRWRWGYTAVGGAIIVLLAGQAGADVSTLVT